MARFPDREAEIKALAQSIITGLTGNPDFPNPPVSPADTLVSQERGKQLEYRAVAVNKAGESGPSNTVTAVL